MASKPLIIFDPFPRNAEMVFTQDVELELNKISNLITYFGSRAPDKLIEENLSEVEIIVGQTSMPKERLDMATKLKAIINVKGNWEANIDYFEAQRRGIYVLSAAPAMAPAVAEACIGYAVSLARGTIHNYNKFINNEEKYGIAGNVNAYTLFNAKVGFIGFGNLAKSLLKLLQPFNCEVSVYDPWLSDSYLETQGVKPNELNEVLSMNQFIFILAGVTSENEGFINKEKLDLIQNDSSVILVSRAEVLDFDYFVKLAKSNIFRAAADVFPEEPVPGDSPYRKATNILFTSHLAGGLYFSYKNIRDMMMDDIKQILKNYPPTRLQRAEPSQVQLRRDR
jgi:phosphoglycerate dehydrogenase-like enzyme